MFFKPFFHAFRAAARLIPPSLLSFGIWPAVAVFAFGRTIGKAGRTWRLCFEESLGRRPGFITVWRSFVSETFVRLATLCPDRFTAPSWRNRFIVSGLEDLLACHDAGTPVVLAVIHCQNLNVIRLFLRAHGLPVASLTYAPGVTDKRRMINHALDRRSPLNGTPHKFSLSELRSAYAFLRAGRCLLVACDAQSEDTVELQSATAAMRIHAGPFRLAGLAQARVVPVVCWQEKPLRFRLIVGEPMGAPARCADLSAFKPLAEHCLTTWRPLLTDHLEQVHFSPWFCNVRTMQPGLGRSG